MKTTLYNHKAVGTAEKPLIPNVIFKSLIWLAENKFFEECQYLEQKYTLTEFQKKLYNEKISK